MGVVLFENTGTFKPSDYGIEPGMQLDIICVGGGGGGGAGYQGGAGGDAGKGGGHGGDSEGSAGGGGGGGGYGGGGGGGGTCEGVSTDDIFGGGGGGGGHLVTASLVITSDNVDTAFPVTVGAGGVGTSDRYTTSTAGGTSSFGDICSAEGGDRGQNGTETSTDEDGDPIGGLGGTGGTNGGDANFSNTVGAAAGGGGGGGGWLPGAGLLMRTNGASKGMRSNGTGGGCGGNGTLLGDFFITESRPILGSSSLLGGAGGNGAHCDAAGGTAAVAGTAEATDGQYGGPGHGCVVICWD